MEQGSGKENSPFPGDHFMVTRPVHDCSPAGVLYAGKAGTNANYFLENSVLFQFLNGFPKASM